MPPEKTRTVPLLTNVPLTNPAIFEIGVFAAQQCAEPDRPGANLLRPAELRGDRRASR